MPNLLGIGTNRGYSMTGFGIGLGLSGYRLGSYIDPTLKLDLNFSQQKSLTALVGPTPSYSRASKGWAFNASGALTEYAINNPRFNHVYNGSSWASRGLLIEEQRTNLVQYSNDLTNSYWTKSNCSATANSIISPDGTQNANLVTFSDSSAGSVDRQVSSTTVWNVSGLAYTQSYFVKAGTQRWIQFKWLTRYSGSPYKFANFDTLNMAFGTVSSGITTSVSDVGNGWYRISATATATATGAGEYLFVKAIDSDSAVNATLSTNGGTVYLYGMQWEETASFQTSYISTPAASSVIRSADLCQITGTNFSNIWNASEGTFVFEGICPATGTLGLLSVNDGTANERMELYASGTDPKFIVVDGGVTQADIDGGSLTANTAFKIAVRYKSNDFALSVNGGAVVADTVGTLPTVSQMQIGCNQAGNYLNGTISRVRYFNSAVADGTLQSLST